MGKNSYGFLDFYLNLGGQIVPVTRDAERRPVIKWKSIVLTKEEIINKYPVSRYNYAFLIPENLCIVDVEVHKGGLKQLEELKNSGINLYETYHNFTGREGVHSFYKIKKSFKIPHGYSENFDAIEILGPGKLVTIPPSIHITGKPYREGKIKQLKKNILPLPENILKVFNYATKDDGNSPDILGVSSSGIQKKIDELEYYLSYLDPKDFATFGKWVRLLFSAYDLTKGDVRGFEAFLKWSLQDENYKGDKKKIRAAWDKVRKIKQDKDDPRNLITYKTLVYVAVKAGAKTRVGAGRLIDEILYNTFTFVSTIENDGEYCRDIREFNNVFEHSPTETINGEKWVRITDGVISRIMGYVFDECGITKNDFINMRIKDRLERARISIFKSAWQDIEFRYRSEAKDIKGLTHTKRLFFDLLKHKDEEHAEKVFPFFVKYLVSGIKANLSEFDDLHRSNSQTCLCISSDRQGLGKSTLARALTPCPEMIYYPNLKNIRDMETKLAISRAAMCIIDDYQPTYQKELNNLNEILTQHTILVRPKYGRIEMSKTKRAYFALTTNYKKILNDFTGTRRWINLDIVGMKIEEVLKLAPAMHGEMIALARANYRHWFNTEEIDTLEELNKPFSGTETLDNIILNHYAENPGNSKLEVPAIEIMQRINKYYGSGTLRDVRQLGATLARLFPNAKNHRSVIEGRKLTTYNLFMIKPFYDGGIVVNNGAVSA